MYLALYRKYRPKTFDTVIGQKHITTTLKNQIKNNQISHAYLFCGSRGTGKTSIAKIFAQSINCENNSDGNACYKCKTCLALSEQNNIDILEIDAASNNRVDEIRELREKVKYPPVNGKYKVYIIDEVHMLTDSAFNALLKTLEEPPSYVVFILATTEVQKLPATILSRCLRFDFKLLSNSELEEMLENIFKDLKISYEKEALSLIASLGEGSARDTLSIAEMVVAFSDKNVTYNSVLEAVGAIDKKDLFKLGKSILTNKADEVINIIDQTIKLGKSTNQIAKDLAEYFRNLAVIKTSSNYENIIKLPKNLLTELSETANSFNINQILLCLKSFSSLENEFRNTQNARLLLEVTALNLCNDINNNILTRLENLEKNLENLEKKSPKTLNLSSKNPTIVKAVEFWEKDEIKEVDLIADKKENTNTKKTDFEKTIIPDLEVEIIKQTNETLKVFSEMDRIENQNNPANSIFGKLLISLRENNEISLHSLLGSSKIKTNLISNEFIMTLFDELKFEKVNRKESFEMLEKLLKTQNENYKLTLKFQEVKNDNKIENKLKELFGNKLIIE